MLHQFNLLVSAMVHFIAQLQYYITFEVCTALEPYNVQSSMLCVHTVEVSSLFVTIGWIVCLL